MKIFNFQFSIFKVLLLSSLFIFTAFPVWATEASDSAVSEDEVKEKIKERLEETVKQGLEKIRGVITQEKENQLYAWVGSIENIDGDRLEIQTKADLCEAEVASNAAIYFLPAGKSKKSIDTEDIKTDQFIIAMGPKLEEKIILAKRIITMDEAPVGPAKRDLIAGKVTEIDEETIVVKKNGDSFQITLDDDTPLQISGIKKPTTEDIQVDDRLTALVSLDKNGEVDTALSVLVIPGSTNPQAEENQATEEDIEESTAPAETEEE